MKLVVAAAEASGDQLLAGILRTLRTQLPALSVSGVGGPAAAAEGMTLVADGMGLGAVGLVESVRVAARGRRVVAALRAELAREPRALLTVDAPSLWLRVAREARAAGVPALHVVAPQVWAWRPGRARRVAHDVDLLLCLLPFEPQWFTGRVRAVFVGHPAAAIVPRPVPRPGSPTIALCPGSRPAELAALWPVFAEVARHLRRERPEVAFLVPVAPGVDPAPLRAVPGVQLVRGMSEVAGADAALVASGTATLELAALDVPMVVAYRVHPLTALVARRVLTLPWVSLPNVLAGRLLVAEHLQDLDPGAIARDLLAVCGVQGQVPRSLVASLEGPRALDNLAREISPWLAGAGDGAPW
jgi:lipid-A-disaccharide synthase